MLIFKSFFLIFAQLQLSHLFPLFSPALRPPMLLPLSIPTPLSVPVSPLYMFYTFPFPFFPHYIPPHSSGHCQFVLYFHVSGSISLICLFC